MASVGTLQDEAAKRKERLKALRDRHKDTDDGLQEKRPKEEKLPRPVFRSYKPLDEGLQEAQLPQAKPAEVTERIKEQLEAAKPEPLVKEVDLVNLAPRKPDWDLKRDVAKKLEILERRTQRAIAELIRERLQTGEQDLATVVNSAVNQLQDDDD